MPEENIPEISPSATLEEIEEIYKVYVRQGYIKDDTRQYEVYMVIFWIAVEFIGIYYFRLPMANFASNQASQMKKFRRHLQRIGEEVHVEGERGKGNPYHSLAWDMLISAAIFIGMQFLILVLSKFLNESAARAFAESIKSAIGNVLAPSFRPGSRGEDASSGEASQGFNLMSLLSGLTGGSQQAAAGAAPAETPAAAGAPAGAPAPNSGLGGLNLGPLIGNLQSFFGGQGDAPTALAGFGSQLLERMQQSTLGGAGTPASNAPASPSLPPSTPVPARRFAAPYDEDQI